MADTTEPEPEPEPEAAADATNQSGETSRQLVPHRPEYSDVGFLSEAEMELRKNQRIENEAENSRLISQKRIKERSAIRKAQDDEKRAVYESYKAHHARVLEKNRRNLAKSPFQVDLVAETERIDEEVQVRLSFEGKMTKAEGKRKMKVMDEVIRSALVEEDDVAALREEKRKLVAEEKRLHALSGTLKSDANLQRKKDRIAEETRQRQLRAQIAEAKRRQVLAAREGERQKAIDALKFRHGVQPSRDMQI
eukprot:SAG22_NODE_5064_length_1095_cov_1.307229_1_plen_250_part_10